MYARSLVQAVHLFHSIELFFLLDICQLLLELHDTLTLVPMTILRPIPVNLLAGGAAVAVGLASLAQLAAGCARTCSFYAASVISFPSRPRP